MTENACSVITPKQMRDARISLGWSRESLSHVSGATAHFIRVYEEFGRVSRLNLRRKGFDGLAAIRKVFETAGIRFSDLSQTPAIEESPVRAVMSEAHKSIQTSKIRTTIKPHQMLAARLLLGWSRERLASLAETTPQFVYLYETEGRVATMYSRPRSFNGLVALRTALETAGVEFDCGGPSGVKLRTLEP